MKNYIDAIKQLIDLKSLKNRICSSFVVPVRKCNSLLKRAIFFGDEAIERFSTVLSGQVQVVQADHYKNIIIIARIDTDNLFVESGACANPVL